MRFVMAGDRAVVHHRPAPETPGGHRTVGATAYSSADGSSAGAISLQEMVFYAELVIFGPITLAVVI